MNPSDEFSDIPLFVSDTHSLIWYFDGFTTLTSVSEMHDRLIVCEAKLRNAKLITRDHEIQNAKVVETVW